MTRSEILTIMTGGMATIAGGVMAAYVQMLGNSYSLAQGVSLDVGRLMFAEQLLGASLMAAPAALVIAKIIFPETDEPVTKGEVKMSVEKTDANGIDAAASGAGTGLKLAANVGAMLLAFIALLAMGNYFLNEIGNLTGLKRYHSRRRVNDRNAARLGDSTHCIHYGDTMGGCSKCWFTSGNQGGTQ